MKKLQYTLLVDDDEATNFINELLIEELNFTEKLLTAQNGKEALDLIRELCRKEAGLLPELILLDINMPVMDGFDFLDAFQALDCPDKKNTRIVMLTTSLHRKDIEKVKDAGVAGFLNKPLTIAALEEILRTHFIG